MSPTKKARRGGNEGMKQKDLVTMMAQRGDGVVSPTQVKLTVGKATTRIATQQLDPVYNQFHTELAKERQKQTVEQLPGRRTRRQQAQDVDMSQDYRVQTEAADEKLGMVSAGLRYVDILQQLVSKDVMPTEEQFAQLVSIIRSHCMHESTELAERAARCLQTLCELHPHTKLHYHNGDLGPMGAPYAAVNEDAWFILERDVPLDLLKPEQMTDLNGRLKNNRARGWVLFETLVGHAASMGCYSNPATAADCEAARQERFGELLLLKVVLAVAGADLRVRVAVFDGAPSHGARANQLRRDTLRSSLLWRLLSDPMCHNSNLKDFVKRLVGMIVEGARSPAGLGARDADSDEEDGNVGQSSNGANSLAEEPGAFAAREVGPLAALLLNAMLELYGTAEDCGMYSAHEKTRGAAEENRRMTLDLALVDCLGANKVANTASAMRALLSGMRPRDALRLLGVLCAKRRAPREADKERYPGLVKVAKDIEHRAGVPSFVDVPATEVLTYIQDDIKTYAVHVAGSFDALAALVAITAQAAMVCAGADVAALEQLQGALQNVTQSMLAESAGGAVGTLKCISPRCTVALAAANHAVRSACAAAAM